MESESNIVMYSVLLGLLILTNAFFAMSEIAILSSNHNKIKKEAANGNKKARVLLQITDMSAEFLATIQVGVTLSGFLASAVAADKFVTLFSSYFSFLNVNKEMLEGIILIIMTLILSYFTLIFGELVPKRVAMKSSEKIALSVALPIWYFYKFSKPFVSLLAASTNAVLRLFGINGEEENDSVTEEEILMLVDEGEENGLIERQEKAMINNIFEFDDKKVSELMTHRVDIVGVELEASIEEVVALARQKGYSRIPVYKEDLDDIVGIIYVKDLLALIGNKNYNKVALINYMHKPMYVPESKCCSELLKQFRQQKIHMAIIIDEYGGTEGLVTLEDLLESIVGNIQDEYDEEDLEVIKISDSLYIFEGSVAIDETEKILGESLFEECGCDTLGGFIIVHLGHIPKKDEEVTITLKEYEISVLEVTERRIEKVKIEKLNPKPIAQAES